MSAPEPKFVEPRSDTPTPTATPPEPKSENATLAGPDETKGEMPEVDLEYAATLKPSRLRGKNLMFMVTFVAGTGFTMFGYDQGVLSSLLTLDSFAETFPQAGGSFSTLQSFMVAIYQIGCMVGALMNLYVGDKLGRKWTIAIGGWGIIAGTVLQTAAVNYDMMCVARVFNGIFNGLLTSTVPAYQSECAKPHQRGPLVILSGTLIGFGIMCSYWVGLGFFYTSGDIQWRFPIAFQAVFTIIMLACMMIFRMPESPRWLVGQGRHAEAIAVLAYLDGVDVNNAGVLETWKGIVDSASQSAGDFALGELFHHGRMQHFRRTCLGFLVQCFQQISGCNLITYYLTSVLDDMGLGPELSRIIAGVNGTCYFLTSIVAIFIIERVGRRPLMLWCAGGMGVTMVILAGIYRETSEFGNEAAQAVSVLCLFVFNCWFTIGWLGMSWLYPAEVTPIRIRAPANAISTGSNWLFNFFVVMVTGPMFESIGWGTYAFFAAMNIVIIWPTVYFLFPETKQRSLEDLDLIFAVANAERKSPVKVSASGILPKAGSAEAEQVLGRQSTITPANNEGKKRFDNDGQPHHSEV